MTMPKPITIIAMSLAAIVIMSHTASAADGCFKMMLDNEDDSGTYFCFDLDPKPPSNTEVTCTSLSAEASCCHGGNGWIFKPGTDMKCGGLTSIPTEDSPVTVTCTADGYSDGSIIMGPPDATGSECPAPIPPTPAATTTNGPTAASAAASSNANDDGCIKMMLYDEDDSGTYFLFDLDPKPPSNTEVTCTSSSEEASCCHGGNGWNFKPDTHMKAGGLTSKPTEDSPVTVTCTADGYSDGSIVMGPPNATGSECPAPLPPTPAATTTDVLTTTSPTASPNTEDSTSSPTSDALVIKQVRTTILVITTGVVLMLTS